MASYSKIQDFIKVGQEAAEQNGIQAKFEPYVFGEGVQITWLERRRDGRVDLDTFLIEITSLADRMQMSLQLSLRHNDMHIKNEFIRHGFHIVEDDSDLQMEREPRGFQQLELDFNPKQPAMESAPPGKKAEDFIKKHKSEFKDRYGKRWKTVLYATAWKKFGESANFKSYYSLIERERQIR